MAGSATSADEFWAAAGSRGWAVADTDVFSDGELVELASGMGPVVIGQRGVEALVTTIPVPAAGDDRAIFHTEDGPAGERVAWVVLHCVALRDCRGGATALASADEIVEHLTTDERVTATQATGTYTVLGHQREWKLLTQLPDGGWSIDLPGASRAPGEPARGLGEVTVPDAGHRAVADRVEALAADVAHPVEWAPGRILVFDNRRYLHARLPLTAGSRTLKRVLVGHVPADSMPPA